MTGDEDDILARLKAVLPPWFADVAPIRDAVLGGMARVMAGIYSAIIYTKAQTRISTASDGWLDLIAYDFFGSRVQRKAGQSDPQLRKAIIVELFRPRGTRDSITRVLNDLTGRVPIIFEPARPQDTGGYGPGLTGDGKGRALAYNAAGGYGSLELRAQVFVTAYRPSSSGIPKAMGYGVTSTAAGYNLGGYGVGSIEYGDFSQVVGAVTDADIYAAVASVMPAGAIAWTHISS